MVGIFLSGFNVHLNRAPVAARVIGLSYRRGKFLNALRAASARENEQMAIRLAETVPPYRRMIVRTREKSPGTSIELLIPDFRGHREPLDAPRHLWWNFVSSSTERIEQAKQDWREGRFGLIPGDDQEFIPLPEPGK